MSIATDTSPEADAVQVEAYRRMGGLHGDKVVRCAWPDRELVEP